MMTSNTWPTQANATAFYGDPRHPGFTQDHLTTVPCPWKLFYGSTPVAHITINKACAESLARVLADIWEKCGKSQATIESHGYHKFSGSYNYRPIRGEQSLSMHAYGAAIDFDAGENEMGPTVGRFKDDDILVVAFKNEGWIWGGDWCGRKDGMHVQAARVR